MGAQSVLWIMVVHNVIQMDYLHHQILHVNVLQIVKEKVIKKIVNVLLNIINNKESVFNVLFYVNNVMGHKVIIV
jgi:hypothetical protein